jgi:hypothetical protein
MGILKRSIIGLVLAGALLTQGSSVLADEPWWWWSHASAYGDESIWDGGWFDYEKHEWGGYYGHKTSWYWNCGSREHLDPDHPQYSWAVLTPKSYGVASRDPDLLGTWVEMRIMEPDGTYGPWSIMPVTDAGPYAAGSNWRSPGWNWDLQEPVVLRAGWGGVAPSRYGDRPGPYWGRRDVMVRYRPDLGRYCPGWGYNDGPPRG